MMEVEAKVCEQRRMTVEFKRGIAGLMPKWTRSWNLDVERLIVIDLLLQVIQYKNSAQKQLKIHGSRSLVW